MCAVFVTIGFGCGRPPNWSKPPTTSRGNTPQHCGASLHATPFWNGGELPDTKSGDSFVLYRDPTAPSQWVLVLANPTTSRLCSAARVDAAQNPAGLGALIAAAQQKAFVNFAFTGNGLRQLDVTQTPRPPPPPPVDPRKLIEIAKEKVDVDTRTIANTHASDANAHSAQ